MEIIAYEKINNQEYDIHTHCNIYYLHVRLKNHARALADFLTSLIDQSWINKLSVCTKISYESRATRTANAITKKIKKSASDKITKDSGEYLISYAATEALAKQCKYTKIPLAELWKEKNIGNPGFDFHSETPQGIILFGESKYSSTSNPHKNAIEQIIDFISKGKDRAELSDLQNFIKETTAKNFIDGKKGFIAAFSLHTKKPKRTILYPLHDAMQIKTLLQQTALYLIGVEF